MATPMIPNGSQIAKATDPGYCPERADGDWDGDLDD